MVALLHWTHAFEWCMARIVIKNRHQNDMCYNDIGLCAQFMDIVLGSIVNILILILKLEMFLKWFDLCVSRMLIGGDNPRYDPTTKIVFGVGSAHTKTTYLRLLDIRCCGWSKRSVAYEHTFIPPTHKLDHYRFVVDISQMTWTRLTWDLKSKVGVI